MLRLLSLEAPVALHRVIGRGSKKKEDLTGFIGSADA